MVQNKGWEKEKGKKKFAVITMDVEDWYTNDYFLDCVQKDTSYSMLDGVDVLKNILYENNVPATFFTLASVVPKIKNTVSQILDEGSEIAVHGLTHYRPVKMGTDEFARQITEAKSRIEDAFGVETIGYRAPTYGIDDERLQIIRDLGFKYDSSKNGFEQFPEYGHLSLKGFTNLHNNIYVNRGFCEFEVSTQRFGRVNLPLGGGYLRMLPWWFNKHQIREFAKRGKLYVLYIHPFELSKKKVPHVRDVCLTGTLRSQLGRRNVDKKVDELIKMMKSFGYEFVTMRDLRKKVLGAMERKKDHLIAGNKTL